jgi:Serine/threonine protein kinase
MIPKYPFLIFPLFLVTSFYFYQIKMVTVSEIYVFLYISFLLSYIFVRHWAVPLALNLLPGLIPAFMANQLAVLINQSPQSVLNGFIFLAIIGIVAGFSLRGVFAGDDNAGGVGFFLVMVGVIFNTVYVLDSRFTPTTWGNAIIFVSPFYFTTSLITQILHFQYKNYSKSPNRKQTYKTPPVHFTFKGLPPGVQVTIAVNGVAYITTSDYLRVQQDGVNDYHWVASDVITPNNETYIPDVREGVASPGQGVVINYILATPQQSSQQSYQYVTFIIRNLPPSHEATITIGGVTYKTSSRLEASVEGSWVADDVIVGNKVYKPHPSSGCARFGDVIIIDYRMVSVHTPSWKLSPGNLQSWDPKVWIGKTLYVYEIKDVIGEGGNGYVLRGEYNGKEVAVKVLKLDQGNAEQFFKELIKESSNLVAISSKPNVVKIYGVYVDEQVLEDILRGDLELYKTQPPMIVMELMKGGSMSDLLNDDSFFYSSKWEKTVYRGIKDMAEALNFLHSQGYVHMDVKPQNIFLTERPKQPYELDNVKFKLGDLGSAVKVNGKINQVTPLYSPPEVYLGVAKPSIDVFSLGMTMYVLLTRREDRPDLNDMEDAFNCYVKGDMNCVKLKVESSKAKLATWDPNVPDVVKPLLKGMLSPDPSKRVTTKEVVQYLNRLIT